MRSMTQERFSMSTNILTTHGSQIVDGEGQVVTLRGFGLGGWMNMENFITGYPANEQAQRDAIRGVIGDELYQLFFDRFLEYFFTEADAEFVRTLGLNLVRLPINYRHFEDDMRPFELKEEGFKHLDRAIDECARHGVYTILDLHAFAGLPEPALALRQPHPRGPVLGARAFSRPRGL